MLPFGGTKFRQVECSGAATVVKATQGFATSAQACRQDSLSRGSAAVQDDLFGNQ